MHSIMTILLWHFVIYKVVSNILSDSNYKTALGHRQEDSNAFQVSTHLFSPSPKKLLKYKYLANIHTKMVLYAEDAVL